MSIAGLDQTYLVFLALFFVVTQDRLGRLVAVDRTITMTVATGAIIGLIPLVLLVGYIVVKGAAGAAGWILHP
ncbi:MAG: hypothetical protein M3Y36_06555 [Actinomycetota bacterium]|nr:hypothetical protein [Actinomycetota bacterium]